MHVNAIASFTGTHAYLSNFYLRQVKVGLVTFPSNEAAFQAAKYKAMTDTSDAGRKKYIMSIANSSSPNQSKYLGKSVRIDLDKWEVIKIACMREVVKAKFDQHADLKLQLLETGASMLVEGNTWGDKFWGRCEGKGLNILGVILMELRGYYYWTEYQSIW
jgi:ribA/ribD-fused uncharacterized protein